MMDRCPRHGAQILLPFCEHAALAIEERRDVPVFVQYYERVVEPPVPGSWLAVCGDCVRRSDLYDVLGKCDGLVCEKCVMEWAETTKNGLIARFRKRRPEFPSDAPVQALRRMWPSDDVEE